MKSIYKSILIAALTLGAASCQDKDYEIVEPILSPVSVESISGALQGNDYVWSWPATAGSSMMVTVYDGNTIVLQETVTGNSFTHPNIDTNIDYTYVFKLTDGTNLSSGVICHYTRPGAGRMTGISMAQVEAEGGYSAIVSWDANTSATSVNLTADNAAGRTITESLPATATTYTIPNVKDGEEWTVTLVAVNAEGSSLPASASLKIGKTAVGFLSIYPNPEDLVANGDDDEASAWLWFHQEYPTGRFLSFSDINSVSDLEVFRVLFWIRDLEGVDESEVFAMPEVVTAATPAIRQWYADGGSLLLWSHATVYIGTLGRIESDMLSSNDHSIGTGAGGFNPDTWNMAVSLNPGGKFTRDHSSHPIYRGLPVTSNDRCKLIAFKGPGWTEDHNCLFFNIPSALTGKGNQDEDCYTLLTTVYGIYPLGTWDSQIDFVSQLNVWEAQQGNTEFKGTVLCIGNGGCEFSLKNDDGTPDISANPKNNPNQANVLTLAKNSIEYLKTR